MSVVHATLEPGAAWNHAVQHVKYGYSLGCVLLQPDVGAGPNRA